MSINKARRLATVVVSSAAISCLAGPSAGETTPGPPNTFVMTSTDFNDGGTIPARSTCLGIGSGQSPELDWTTPPDGTVELALIVRDPDTVVGTLNHWVVWKIPADDRHADHSALPPGARTGLNSLLLPGWLPPCAPSTEPHRYIFTLYALDTSLTMSGLLPPTANHIEQATSGHVLAETSLTGRSSLL